VFLKHRGELKFWFEKGLSPSQMRDELERKEMPNTRTVVKNELSLLEPVRIRSEDVDLTRLCDDCSAKFRRKTNSICN